MMFDATGIVYSNLPIEGRIVIALFSLCFLVALIYTIYIQCSPLLIVQSDGFLCYPFGSLKKVKIVWESVVNIAEDELPNSIFKKRNRLTVVYVKNNGIQGRVVINSISLKDGDEAIALLKAIVFSKINNSRMDASSQETEAVNALSIRVDDVVALLLISGFIIGIGGFIVLTFYPPTIGSTWLYPLLMLPLSGVPLLLTYKMINSAAHDKTKKLSARYAALGFNLGTVFALMFMFFMSPASFYWILADFNGIRGSVDRAEYYYQKAEIDLSENSDFLYAFAQMYYRIGDWENAARYFTDSYEKDPTNWMREPLIKVVDALAKAGKTAEAVDWCDRITREYAENRGIVKLFEQKKGEITGPPPKK
jgi:tetratricopeptide (TPR) repeat protein